MAVETEIVVVTVQSDIIVVTAPTETTDVAVFVTV